MLPPLPVECPVCNGAVVAEHGADGAIFYVCRGTTGREEVERRLVSRLTKMKLAGVENVPPCGFRGALADYGTIWA